MMSGFTAPGTNRDGHAWIVDGFVDAEAYKCTYNISPDRDPILVDRRAVGSVYVVHVNWG